MMYLGEDTREFNKVFSDLVEYCDRHRIKLHAVIYEAPDLSLTDKRYNKYLTSQGSVDFLSKTEFNHKIKSQIRDQLDPIIKKLETL